MNEQNQDVAEQVHAAIEVWGASHVIRLMEDAQKLNADPSFRPWTGRNYEAMKPGPVAATLAELAGRPEVTRVDYRFGKRAGGDGELVHLYAQRAGR